MTTELVLAVNCGTTACRACAVDLRGQIHADAELPLELTAIEPDGWEQDAESWWQAWQGTIGRVTQALGSAVSGIRALAVTHQRETVVLTDERSRPLRPALLWKDARCRDQVVIARRQVGADRLHRLTGKPPCTVPSLYKLMWLFAQEPELAQQRPKVLDVHGFLTWRATGRRATSLASADPMGLVKLASRDWCDELLELAGIERDQLPELVAPGELIGQLEPGVAAECGLPAGLPVIAGLGDGQAAGLGVGITDHRRAYVHLGEAIVSGVLSREYRRDHTFRTHYAGTRGTYFLESALLGGTSTIEWMINQWLQPGRSPEPPFAEVQAALEQQAAGLPPGAEGLVLVPYWNGVMNPYWDNAASGIVIGWSGHHGPAHLFRAILEGIAFELRLQLRGIEQVTRPVEALVLVGPGSSSDLWCQIIADVTLRPVIRAGVADSTVLGAALIAATGVQLHRDLRVAAHAMTSLGASFAPGPNAGAYGAYYADVYGGLYPALRDRMRRLGLLRRRYTPSR